MTTENDETKEPAGLDETPAEGAAQAADESPEAADSAAAAGLETGAEAGDPVEPAEDATEAGELRAALEAILFVSSDPVKIEDLAESFPGVTKEQVNAQLEVIRRGLDEHVAGFMLEAAAGGWRLTTRPEHDPMLRKYFARKGENRMSLAALETLAIVAYRQPITAPEVSEIRSVNSTAVIRTLLERRMIRVAGRKNVVGSPFLYRTTKEFLVHFGLNDIRDLPRLEEFGDLIGENINDDLVAAINAADSPEQSLPGGNTAAETMAEGDADSDDAVPDQQNSGVDAEDASVDRGESQLESNAGSGQNEQNEE